MWNTWISCETYIKHIWNMWSHHIVHMCPHLFVFTCDHVFHTFTPISESKFELSNHVSLHLSTDNLSSEHKSLISEIFGSKILTFRWVTSRIFEVFLKSIAQKASSRIEFTSSSSCLNDIIHSHAAGSPHNPGLALNLPTCSRPQIRQNLQSPPESSHL